MKIICDNCRTKYSISDDKVRGKAFKIRCKKCQNVIVVKGEAGDGAGHKEEDEQGTVVADTGALPVWHLVIGGQQAGPFTVAEVGDKYVRGEIDAGTYAWRDGLPDWSRMTDIEEFAHLRSAEVSAPQAAPMRAPDDDARTSVLNTGAAGAAAPVRHAPSDDLFGAGGAGGGGGGGAGADAGWGGGGAAGAGAA
ncbi:MAG TPA: GYF domain-containing protein, partial [Myxococcota bacterium]|nr:GYF domain-containing protein [Myxococcota bacterium]